MLVASLKGAFTTAHRVTMLRQGLEDASASWEGPGVASRRTITHSGILYERLLHELTLGWFTLTELSERTGLNRQWVTYVMTAYRHHGPQFADLGIRKRPTPLRDLRSGGCSSNRPDAWRYHLAGRKTPTATPVLDWRHDG